MPPNTASQHVSDCGSSVASHSSPQSIDKPLTSPPLSSSSSLQLFKAQSLLLPLPRGLQPLLLQHADAAITSPVNGTALSLSLILHVDVSASSSAESADGESSSHSHCSSSLLDWTAIVAQLHFITQHYPVNNLHTLANVIATYLSLSNQLTTITPAAPSPIRQLTLHLSLLPPPPTSPTLPLLHHTTTVAQCDLQPPANESNGWGKVDILIETSAPSAGLYLLHVDPHCSIPSHVHRVMCEAEMVLTDGLQCQDTAARWGAVHAWGEAVHGYTNDSGLPATVLCIDTPAFIPADEIVVTGQAMAAVEVQQAGQSVWQHLARSLFDQQYSEPMPTFVFPAATVDRAAVSHSTVPPFSRPMQCCCLCCRRPPRRPPRHVCYSFVIVYVALSCLVVRWSAARRQCRLPSVSCERRPVCR